VTSDAQSDQVFLFIIPERASSHLDKFYKSLVPLLLLRLAEWEGAFGPTHLLRPGRYCGKDLS
jgi:hypothetical protein